MIKVKTFYYYTSKKAKSIQSLKSCYGKRAGVSLKLVMIVKKCVAYLIGVFLVNNFKDADLS